jgi:hypothetical protein
LHKGSDSRDHSGSDSVGEASLSAGGIQCMLRLVAKCSGIGAAHVQLAQLAKKRHQRGSIRSRNEYRCREGWRKRNCSRRSSGSDVGWLQLATSIQQPTFKASNLLKLKLSALLRAMQPEMLRHPPQILRHGHGNAIIKRLKRRCAAPRR